jgi:hypothetical protein
MGRTGMFDEQNGRAVVRDPWSLSNLGGSRRRSENSASFLQIGVPGCTNAGQAQDERGRCAANSESFNSKL